MSDPSKFNIPKEVAKGVTLHSNVRQEYIVISADKARLCLHKHLTGALARSAWIAPAGIFLALLLPMVSADFKDVLGVSKSVWQAAALMGSFLTTIWLLSAIVQSARCRSRTGDPIEDIVAQMKNETPKYKLEESEGPGSPAQE
jgi:hypothetical protein